MTWGHALTLDAPIAAQSQGVRLCRALLFAFGLALLAPVAAAQAQRIDFDIPAQALDQALEAFGAASGFQIFYETALTDGHTSRAVKGIFDRETALRILLDGSGLTGRAIASNTVTIAQSVGVGIELSQAKRAAVSRYGLMQAGIMSALCRSPVTRPGTYRIAMQYWIDPSGRIADVRLIGSSGYTRRDDAIVQAVQAVAFEPSLRSLPQPVTVAIEPTAVDAHDECMPNRAKQASAP